MKKVLISGGFDPIHSGHIQYIKDAAKLGQVTVLVNDDQWLVRKKGYWFMPAEERLAIIKEIKGVFHAEVSYDILADIERLKPDILFNGGDRNSDTASKEEVELCERIGIELVYGGEKINSSSQILNDYFKSQLFTLNQPIDMTKWTNFPLQDIHSFVQIKEK